MTLLYAGIDEAGYGPLLGPLTLGLSVWRIDTWDPGDPAPDLWMALERTVGRTARDAPARIPIADSKKLKLANSTKTKHPLVHLERGVLAAASLRGLHPDDDAALLDVLGTAVPSEPWYAGPETLLPVGNDAGELKIVANAFRRDADRAGVGLELLRCDALSETVYNHRLRELGGKSAVVSDACATLIASAVRAAADDPDQPALRIICDRQSGRTDYLPLLTRALPGSEWSRVASGDAVVRYTLEEGSSDAWWSGLDVAVTFAVEAEAAHLPVALASMTAKLVRELMMIRFNRHWCGRLPELKPTAGYTTDGRRWLADAAPVLTPGDRAGLIRLA